MNEEMLKIFRDSLYSKLIKKFRNVSIRCYYPDGETYLKVTIYAGDFRYYHCIDNIQERISMGITSELIAQQIVRDFLYQLSNIYMAR